MWNLQFFFQEPYFNCIGWFLHCIFKFRHFRSSFWEEIYTHWTIDYWQYFISTGDESLWLCLLCYHQMFKLIASLFLHKTKPRNVNYWYSLSNTERKGEFALNYKTLNINDFSVKDRQWTVKFSFRLCAYE